MSDTPETDAQTWAGHCGDGDWGKVVYAHWAQKLERERDEARRDLSDLMEEYEDRRNQWGDEYLWDRHEDSMLIDDIHRRIISLENAKVEARRK